MTDAEIEAVAKTLGLILDELQIRRDDGVRQLREAVTAVGDLLAERGGLTLMFRVFEAVMDQKPEAESWREGVVDARWSGFGGWCS